MKSVLYFIIAFATSVVFDRTVGVGHAVAFAACFSLFALFWLVRRDEWT